MDKCKGGKNKKKVFTCDAERVERERERERGCTHKLVVDQTKEIKLMFTQAQRKSKKVTPRPMRFGKKKYSPGKS